MYIFPHSDYSISMFKSYACLNVNFDLSIGFRSSDYQDAQ